MQDLIKTSYTCAPNVERNFFVTEEDDKVYMNMAVQRPESFTGEIMQGQIWRKELYPSMSETLRPPPEELLGGVGTASGRGWSTR